MLTAYRPWFGRALTVAIAVLCAIGLVITIVQDGAVATWRFGPWLLLFAGMVWALYWKPVIEVRNDGARLVNIVRTIDIPWQGVTAVDTTWSLTFVTDAGRFTAWAAPAPSAVSSIRQARRRQGVMRRDADRVDPGRLADDPVTRQSSSQALRLLTQEIQQAWDGARTGGTESGTASGTARSVSVRWHGRAIGVGAVLVAWGVLAAVTA